MIRRSGSELRPEAKRAQQDSFPVKSTPSEGVEVPRWRVVSLLLMGLLAMLGVHRFLTPERLAASPAAVSLAAWLEPVADGAVVAHLGDVRRRAEEIAMVAAARTATSPEALEAGLRALYLRDPRGEMGRVAIKGLVELARADWPRGPRGDFLAQIAPASLASALENHIPPSISLAQAALESSWGRSKLSREHHNLFGIKGGGRKSVTYFPNNGNRRHRTSYRSYDSWGESVAHHAELLATGRAYAKARPLWEDWRAYIAVVAPRYASNGRYAKEVGWYVETFDLDRWDALVVEAAGAEADAVADAASFDEAPER